MKKFLLIFLCLCLSCDCDVFEKNQGMRGEEYYQKVPIHKLIHKLKSEHEFERRNALKGLAYKGKKAAPAVPILIKMFKRTTINERVEIIKVFRDIGPPAKKALPLLIKLLKNPSSRRTYRNVLFKAITEIDQDGDQVYSHLAKILKEKKFDIDEWQATLEAVVRIAQKNSKARLFIRKFLRQRQKQQQRPKFNYKLDIVLTSLCEDGYSDKSLMPILMKIYKDNSRGLYIRFLALRAVYKVTQNPQLILPKLYKHLKNNSDIFVFDKVMDTFLFLEGDAKPAIPFLIKLFKNIKFSTKKKTIDAKVTLLLVLITIDRYDSRVKEILIQNLRNPDLYPYPRRHLTNTFYEAPERKTADALLEYLKDGGKMLPSNIDSLLHFYKSRNIKLKPETYQLLKNPSQRKSKR